MRAEVDAEPGGLEAEDVADLADLAGGQPGDRGGDLVRGQVAQVPRGSHVRAGRLAVKARPGRAGQVVQADALPGRQRVIEGLLPQPPVVGPHDAGLAPLRGRVAGRLQYLVRGRRWRPPGPGRRCCRRVPAF